MPKKKITGVGVGTPLVSGSISWEYVASNQDLARRVIVFLEPRRVLSESPQRADYEQCRLSAQDIKNFLATAGAHGGLHQLHRARDCLRFRACP
jgi:hypothetical protein